MGADHVGQLVLGAAAVGRVIGQQQRDASQAEDAVGDQHGTLVAIVQVHQDVLRTRDQDAHVAVVLRSSDTHTSDPLHVHIRPHNHATFSCSNLRRRDPHMSVPDDRCKSGRKACDLNIEGYN